MSQSISVSSTSTASRDPKKTRYWGIDATRGLAILAMMVPHVFAMNQDEGRSEASILGWIFDGRGSVLFMTLAGISLGLMTGGFHLHNKAKRRLDYRAVAVRGVAIASLGLSLGNLDTGISQIFITYGVIFLLVIPFLRFSAKTYFILTGIFAIIGPLLVYFIRPYMPQSNPHFEIPPAGQIKSWQYDPTTFTYPEDESMFTLNWDSLLHPDYFLSQVFLTGYFPVLEWIGLVFLGLGLARLNLNDLRVIKTIGVYGLIAFILGTFIGDNSVVDESGIQWLVTNRPHSGKLFDMLSSGGIALMILGFFLWLAQCGSQKVERFLVPLTGLGLLSLTMYTLHRLLMCEAEINIPESFPDFVVYLIQAVFGLVVGYIFYKKKWRGPFEGLLGQLTVLARKL